MRKLLAMAWLLVVVPVSGAAQDLPGIDLSKPPSTPQAPEVGRPADDKPAPDAATSRAQLPPPRTTEQAPEPANSGLPFSDKDVALGDKVKAVQRKGFMKRGRFEVTPMLSVSVNDAFNQKLGAGLRLAYHLHDSFAVALRGACYYDQWRCGTSLRSDNVREGKLAFQSQILASQPYGQLMLDGIWSPVYGKAAFLGQSIIHFDLFLSAGFGLIWTATSMEPRNEGPHVATDLGGGVRFYPREWLAFELGLMATLYPDQPQESVPGTIQKVFAANVGFSFFFPTKFEYVHP
jgi:outer membrane beta-barrel protein